MKLKLFPSTIKSPFFALPLCDSNYNASSSSSSSVHIVAASKNKKKHRNDSQGSQSQPTPPRITSNDKHNIRFLHKWKEYQNQKSSSPRPCKSYRKKKAEKEHIPDDIDDDDLYHDYKNQLDIIENAAPVMLVDGYNVCGYWAKLKKHFMNGNLELARQKLIDDLIAFSLHREFKVVVVFDAMTSGFPNHKQYATGVDIVFSSETSADTWIENEVSALKEDGCPHVWVVTSDHCQQEAVNEAGAFVWSCEALITEIKASQKKVDEMLQKQRPTFEGRLLKHNLDTKVVDALKNLRQKLSENESKKNMKLKLK